MTRSMQASRARRAGRIQGRKRTPRPPAQRKTASVSTTTAVPASLPDGLAPENQASTIDLSTESDIEYDSDATIMYEPEETTPVVVTSTTAASTSTAVVATSTRDRPDITRLNHCSECVVSFSSSRVLVMSRCYNCQPTPNVCDDPQCCLDAKREFNQESAKCAPCIRMLTADCPGCADTRRNMPGLAPALAAVVCCIDHRSYMTPNLYYKMCPLCSWRMDRAGHITHNAPELSNRHVCSFHCGNRDLTYYPYRRGAVAAANPRAVQNACTRLPAVCGPRISPLAQAHGLVSTRIDDIIEHQEGSPPVAYATALFTEGYIPYIMYSNKELGWNAMAACHLLLSSGYRSRVRQAIAVSWTLRDALAAYCQAAPATDVVRQLYENYMPNLCTYSR